MRKSAFVTRLALCLAVLGTSLVLTGAAAQASAHPPAVLHNHDGTLSLPSAAPGDGEYATNFTLNGVSDVVEAIAVDAGGNVYAGGNFSAAGGTAANFVAKWNKTAWSALSSGTNSIVHAVLADASGNVYVGGGFTVAADSRPGLAPRSRNPQVAANFVAKWNGTGWSNLGSGFDGAVLALAEDASGNLYAGGDFSTSGGVTVNHVAKWNGTGWSAVGNGFNNTVHTLAVDGGNNVYAGGEFNLACDATCSGLSTVTNRIAKWNGTAWSAVGNGFNGSVFTLVVDNSNNVYAGGAFTLACDATCNPISSVSARVIAKWNGLVWSPLANGLNSGVYALAFDASNNLYAGGLFSRACDATCSPASTPTRNIARWNGTAWSAVGNGTGGPVFALARSGNNLYVGGGFDSAGNVAAAHIARWDTAGGTWSALGSGDAPSYAVYALARDSANKIYAGGLFQSAGNVVANYIAQWDASSGGTGAWTALGYGLNGPVTAIVVDGSNNVYAGGWFTEICADATCTSPGTPAHRVAKWNGTAWSAVGNGVNDIVWALALDSSNNLYAGGDFTLLCDATCSGASTPVNRFAKWNGSAWSSVGNGFNNSVRAIAVDGSNNVYAGGYFTLACDATCGGSSIVVSYISKWNGTAWSALAGGLNSIVYAIVADPAIHSVYAGGHFTSAGFQSLGHIARWDGSTWFAVGNGLDNDVFALALDAPNVYAGGLFTAICGVQCLATQNTPANHIARWSGRTWAPLGSGTSAEVEALAMRGKRLYAGGWFTEAGGKVSAYLTSIGTGQLFLPMLER